MYVSVLYSYCHCANINFVLVNELQLLDLLDHNEHVGYWSLLLSQLPFIYDHLREEHLEILAEEMVKAVLSEGGRTKGGKEGRGRREEGKAGGERIQRIRIGRGDQHHSGVTLLQLVSIFLESEGFVEMNCLQELLLNKFCAHLQSLMRKR